MAQRWQSSGVDVTFEDHPVAQNFNTYGGARLLNNQLVFDCTSGFTVRLNAGARPTGVATAGHCSVGWYENPVDGTRSDMDRVAQHIGDYGDMEWHIVDGPEYPVFWAAFDQARTVSSIDTSIAVGDYFCGYGRKTGVRLCDEVLKTSVSVTILGVTSKKLVAMEKLQWQEGDSGGPWFLNYAAAGIIKGYGQVNGYSRDLWTRAMYFEEGLGVTVMVGS